MDKPSKRRRLSNRAGDREQRLAKVISSVLPTLELTGRVLAVGDDGSIEEQLSPLGTEVEVWHRYAYGGRPATAWPGAGPFDAAFIRLPRSRVAQEMTLHATAQRLKPGAPLWVYGANDEGIRSYSRHLDPLFESVETVATKHHCRVIAGDLRPEPPPLRGALDDWAEDLSIPLPASGYDTPTLSVRSWPGLFAHNRLDPGSARLLAALPGLSPRGRVLDFGCGSGVLALAARQLNPALELTLLDVDALAVHAVGVNVPGAEVILSDRWAQLPPSDSFDLILSNPPIHIGKDEDFSALTELITNAPERLRDRGKLVVVAQRTAGIGTPMKSAFDKSRTLSRDSHFEVWCGEKT